MFGTVRSRRPNIASKARRRPAWVASSRWRATVLVASGVNMPARMVSTPMTTATPAEQALSRRARPPLSPPLMPPIIL